MASKVRLIKITRSGGFAGITRAAVVDATQEASTVNYLATELAKLETPGPGVPDGFMYQFSVEDGALAGQPL